MHNIDINYEELKAKFLAGECTEEELQQVRDWLKTLLKIDKNSSDWKDERCAQGTVHAQIADKTSGRKTDGSHPEAGG